MKKAIVIGATSGIGKGLAKLLVPNNYKRHFETNTEGRVR